MLQVHTVVRTRDYITRLTVTRKRDISKLSIIKSGYQRNRRLKKQAHKESHFYMLHIRAKQEYLSDVYWAVHPVIAEE